MVVPAEGSEMISSKAEGQKSNVVDLSPRGSDDANKDVVDNQQELEASDAKDEALLASLMKGSSHSL